MKQTTRRKAAALAVGASALLLWTPVAGADDPQQDCDQLPPDQVQQCQQQKGAGIANRAVDEAKQGADQAQKQLQQQQQKQQTMDKLMSQGLMYLVNGVPTCLHSGAVLTNVTVTPVIPVQTC